MPSDQFLFPTYRLPSVSPQGSLPPMRVDTPPGAFGAAGAQQLQQGGQQLDRASDNVFSIEQKAATDANRTRLSELNNQYVEGQTQILSTGKDAYYTKQGSDAIQGAGPTMQALQDLKKNILSQPMSEDAKGALNERLNLHIQDATSAIGRHVANQSLVWRDQVAKGTVAAATNQMTANYNDSSKIGALSTVVWQTEYDRSLKQLGDTPEGRVAAKASADSMRSNALKATITTLAVDSPLAAQRLLDAHRTEVDSTDIPGLSAVIKDASLKRQTQNIVNLVTATGGVSPNYNAKVAGAEGAASPFEENKIGALGKYQMIPSTYTDLAQQTDWGKGKSQAEVRAMLLDQKDGPTRQEQLQGLYNNRSVEKLREAGVPVNDLTLYTSHFLGQGAGPAILKLPDDTPLQAGLLKAHGGDAAFVQKVNGANPFLAKVETVGDLKALLAQKIGAPQTLAATGTPTKPNLETMLSSGLAMAGTDPDLRDRVTQAIKTDYATKYAIYNAQVGGLEKQAYAHIDAGGTMENLPTEIRAGLDSDALLKVNQYEEKRLEKRRKDNAEMAGKGLTDLERLGQLTVEDVEKVRTALPQNEYRAWQRRAVGIDRLDDPASYERLQRGLGTRDLRDDIFSEYNAGNLSRESMDRLLDKNSTFMKDNSAPTPYKVASDSVKHRLDPGLIGSGISRDIYGRAVTELDQYVAGNPQRESETEPQFRKRLGDFADDTVKRYQLIDTQEQSIGKPIPSHAALNRADMMGDKSTAMKKIAAANGELSEKFKTGDITEEQYNRDAMTLLDWLQFVQGRPETPPKKP